MADLAIVTGDNPLGRSYDQRFVDVVDDGAGVGLTSPTTQGWQCRGRGKAEAQDSSPLATLQLGTTATTLRNVSGNRDLQVVWAKGSHWLLEDLNITGWAGLSARSTALARDEGDRSDAGVGVYVYHPGADKNGSKAVINRVAISGCKTGVLLGNTAESPHSGDDNTTIYNLVAAYCDDAVITVDTPQAMSNRIYNLHWRHCGAGVLWRGGGNVEVTGFECESDSTILKVTAAATRVADNNNTAFFTNGKIDSLGNPLTLVDHTAASNAKIYAVFRSIDHVAPGAAVPVQATLRNGSIVSVEHFYGANTASFTLHNDSEVVIRGGWWAPAATKANYINAASGGGIVRFCHCHVNGSFVEYDTVSTADP